MASIDIHLDWLRYSVAWDETQSERDNILDALPPFQYFTLTEREVSIGQGYNKGLALNSGMVFWHSTNRKQGVSVQLSGVDLQGARNAGIDESDLLRGIQRKNARFTTIHSCINVHDASASPRDVLTARDNGTLDTRAREIGVYSSTSKVRKEWLAGDTVYIGSPKSAIQIRIYNKAAEQHITGDWTRIEIVFRGEYAQMAVESMCKYGIPSVTRMAVQKQANFSAGWWVYAMRGGISPPMQVKRKESGRATWLKNVVLPALRKEIEEERERKSGDVYERFAAFIDSIRPV